MRIDEEKRKKNKEERNKPQLQNAMA